MKNMTSKGKKIQSKKTHQAYCFVPEVQKNSRSWLNLYALHAQNSKRKGKDDQALISGCRNQCPCQRLRTLHPKKKPTNNTIRSDDNILESFHQTQSINIKIPRPFWNEQPSWQIHILDLVETNSQTITRRKKVIKEEPFGVERRMKTRKRRRQERDYLWQECRGVERIRGRAIKDRINLWKSGHHGQPRWEYTNVCWQSLNENIGFSVREMHATTFKLLLTVFSNVSAFSR